MLAGRVSITLAKAFGEVALAREAAIARHRLGCEATAASVEAEEADALIVAVGSTPFVPPIAGLDGANVIVAPFVRVIGDAVRVATITQAVYQGYHAALDI